jgi:hypothetical protein
MRRLFLVEASEHDRRESREQQCAGTVELVRIARANQIDTLLQFYALGPLDNRGGFSRDRNRRKPDSLALEASGLVFLEVDVDQDGVVRLEPSFFGRRLQRAIPPPACAGYIIGAIRIGLRSGLGVAGHLIQTELLHQSLPVFRTHGFEQLELLFRRNL